jgi:putative heme-binding domain-containing protein
MEGVGYEIGPNLATIQNRGAETILVNVIDPNREVNPQYVNYVVALQDGKTLTGMIAAETATSVTLKRQENATDTVLRVNIDEMRSTGLSIMPEGMEKDIDQQAMADLIAYLLSVK